jgi:hypothetical protein
LVATAGGDGARNPGPGKRQPRPSGAFGGRLFEPLSGDAAGPSAARLPIAVLPGFLSRPFAGGLRQTIAWLGHVRSCRLDRPSLERRPMLDGKRLVVNIADHMRPGLENDLPSGDRALNGSVNDHLIG